MKDTQQKTIQEAVFARQVPVEREWLEKYEAVRDKKRRYENEAKNLLKPFEEDFQKYQQEHSRQSIAKFRIAYLQREYPEYKEVLAEFRKMEADPQRKSYKIFRSHGALRFMRAAGFLEFPYGLDLSAIAAKIKKILEKDGVRNNRLGNDFFKKGYQEALIRYVQKNQNLFMPVYEQAVLNAFRKDFSWLSEDETLLKQAIIANAPGHRICAGLAGEIISIFPREEFREKMAENPVFIREKQNQEIQEIIQRDYFRLFQDASEMKRNFIIHEGPTNSGKTYTALQKLKTSSKGVYLGPLRLLAFEVFQDLNDEGIPASLITGEEEILVPEARITCSTCEMANLKERYEIAVIDEAQMVADKERGGAWTNALMGLQADEIHICCSSDSAVLLENLIRGFSNTACEVVHHTRKTPLEFSGTVRKKELEPGDACVVFGRKKVHGLAWDLRHLGYKVSMIYGAMPYSVRQNEARKFREGKTDILVTTDAIGMGLNLPIRRLIFFEASKFDGFTFRPLRSPEIKQIAGRAGRYGQYSTGYVAVAASQDKKRIQQGMEKEEVPLSQAVIGFPVMLLQYPQYPVSVLLKAWQKCTNHHGYFAQSIQQQIVRAEYLETLTDDTETIWHLTSMTLDNEDSTVFGLWKKWSQKYIKREFIDVPYTENSLIRRKNLNSLEDAFRELDLLFQFYRLMGDEESVKTVMDLKEVISNRMMHLLEQNTALERKRCSSCGKILPWNYPYGICSECHSRRKRKYWDDDFDDDDYWY